MELTPEERARLEAIRDEIGPAHPYVVDGFRAQIGGKLDVKAERKRIARARAAWASLDPVTQNWLRWMTAERVIELAARSSNTAVANAIGASSEDELARLRAELAEGYRFEDTGDGFEVAEECPVAPGEGPGPIDPPAMLDEAENAMRLPTGRAEELPNLRSVVDALWDIWRRDQPFRSAKVTAEAIGAIAGEIGPMFGLSPDEAHRRVKVSLREIDEHSERGLLR